MLKKIPILVRLGFFLLISITIALLFVNLSSRLSPRSTQSKSSNQEFTINTIPSIPKSDKDDLFRKKMEEVNNRTEFSNQYITNNNLTNLNNYVNVLNFITNKYISGELSLLQVRNILTILYYTYNSREYFIKNNYFSLPTEENPVYNQIGNITNEKQLYEMLKKQLISLQQKKLSNPISPFTLNKIFETRYNFVNDQEKFNIDNIKDLIIEYTNIDNLNLYINTIDKMRNIFKEYMKKEYNASSINKTKEDRIRPSIATFYIDKFGNQEIKKYIQSINSSKTNLADLFLYVFFNAKLYELSFNISANELDLDPDTKRFLIGEHGLLDVYLKQLAISVYFVLESLDDYIMVLEEAEKSISNIPLGAQDPLNQFLHQYLTEEEY